LKPAPAGFVGATGRSPLRSSEEGHAEACPCVKVAGSTSPPQPILGEYPVASSQFPDARFLFEKGNREPGTGNVSRFKLKALKHT
jgi:hypothetical protein